ncbi:zinc finger MYND domain-containing protein 12 [Amia ocellicauda]|uniref:zinc finger MYND domain-containing protein 12 n=1 Tax=Amia ocellicauda TaxID=2972642 RepID=UPI0034641701
MCSLNPLAHPRGPKLLCELCHKPAAVQCRQCRVAYYCDSEHQRADWVGIHERVCQLLIPLRCPVPFHALEVEREQHRARLLSGQEELIAVSRAAAQKKLFEGKHQEAVPGALLSLRYCSDVHGPDALQLVPSYLLLAEANIGEFGPRAWLCHWVCGHRVALSMHVFIQHFANMLLSTVYVARLQGPGIDRSLLQCPVLSSGLVLSCCVCSAQVYLASEEFGTDSIVTCGGFFHMADVFARQDKTDVADSLYTEVTRIWHSHLTWLFDERAEISSVSASPAAPVPSLDESQAAEAHQVLSAILAVRERASHPEPADIARTAHALALLHSLDADAGKAVMYGRKALLSSQLVPDCGLTQPIERLLQLAEPNAV